MEYQKALIQLIHVYITLITHYVSQLHLGLVPALLQLACSEGFVSERDPDQARHIWKHFHESTQLAGKFDGKINQNKSDFICTSTSSSSLCPSRFWQTTSATLITTHSDPSLLNQRRPSNPNSPNNLSSSPQFRPRKSTKESRDSKSRSQRNSNSFGGNNNNMFFPIPQVSCDASCVDRETHVWSSSCTCLSHLSTPSSSNIQQTCFYIIKQLITLSSRLHHVIIKALLAHLSTHPNCLSTFLLLSQTFQSSQNNKLHEKFLKNCINHNLFNLLLDIRTTLNTVFLPKQWDSPSPHPPTSQFPLPAGVNTFNNSDTSRSDLSSNNPNNSKNKLSFHLELHRAQSGQNNGGIGERKSGLLNLSNLNLGSSSRSQHSQNSENVYNLSDHLPLDSYRPTFRWYAHTYIHTLKHLTCHVSHFTNKNQ